MLNRVYYPINGFLLVLLAWLQWSYFEDVNGYWAIMNVVGLLSHVINCCILSFNTGMQWSYLEVVNGYWGIMNVAGILLHFDNYSC